jgi:hypothetical protein
VSNPCEHIESVESIQVGGEKACVECLKIGSTWVHLRTCQTCGNTHCCDNSPKKHATAHFKATDHPVVASAQPGERWLWCYADEKLHKY